MAVKTTSTTSRISPWLAPLLYRLGRYAILPLYFDRIEVTDWQNLPMAGPLLLAPTHRSRWDAFMVPYVAGRDITGQDLRFMVSLDEMQGLQGWIVRRFGGFPVDTRRPTVACLRHGVELLQAGENLVIFPEGNIFRDHQLHPLKPGLARLAIQAESDKPGLDLKIVPIRIHYSQPVPRWRCHVNIRIGPPLKAADYCLGLPKQEAQRLTADLERSLRSLSTCVHAPTSSVHPRTQN